MCEQAINNQSLSILEQSQQAYFQPVTQEEKMGTCFSPDMTVNTKSIKQNWVQAVDCWEWDCVWEEAGQEIFILL